MSAEERPADMSTAASAFIRALEGVVQHIVDARVDALPRPTSDGPRWMTTSEAAAHLRLTETALRKRTQRGLVPTHRDGSRLLFDRAELDRVVQDSTNWGERRANGPAPWPQEVQLP